MVSNKLQLRKGFNLNPLDSHIQFPLNGGFVFNFSRLVALFTLFFQEYKINLDFK